MQIKYGNSISYNTKMNNEQSYKTDNQTNLETDVNLKIPG